MVPDPRTILPDLSWAIGANFTIWALAKLIDPTQYTFSQFLADFQASGALGTYADFFLSQVEMAINGLVISDIPTSADVASFVYYMAEAPYSYIPSFGPFPDNTPLWGGSVPYLGPGSCPLAGYAWNGVYGVFDAYGAYPSPVAIPSGSPAHLIDIMNTDAIVAEFQQAWGTDVSKQKDMLAGWVVPWVYDKLTLGLMARWKAIYLINGYDKVWSTLQNLCFLANKPLPPRPTIQFTSNWGNLLIKPSFIASENWSARELCFSVLNVDGSILEGVQNGSLIWVGTAGNNGYSLFSLVQALDNIANGNWAGPPSYSSSGNGPTRPLGFRDRLAAAAV